MTKKPAKDIVTYAIELFGWGLLLVYLYKKIFFRSIPGVTLTHSRLIFWSIWLCLTVFGLLITPRRKRTGLSVMATINTPITIYFLISYHDVYPRLVSAVSIVLLLIIGCYTELTVLSYIPDIRAGKYRGKMSRLIRSVFHRNRMIAGLCLSAVFLVFYVHLFTGAPVLSSNVTPNDPRFKDQKIAGNIDTVLYLQEHLWADLPAQDRLDVLQTIANIEATYLGLPHELNVTSEFLGEKVLGHYQDSTHTITVDTDFLIAGTAHELLDTLTHEAYHAYERRLVDLYVNADPQEQKLILFHRITVYKDEFENYIDGLDNPIGYYMQSIESDSNSYAESAVIDYYDAIDDHLNEKQQGGASE